jgi:hypothetical protein
MGIQGLGLAQPLQYAMPVALLAASSTEVCVDESPILQELAAGIKNYPFMLCEAPPKVRLVTSLFCATVAAGIAMHIGPAMRWYSWFHSSNLEAAKSRGLGYGPCKLYGYISIQHLAPRTLWLAGVSLIATLLLSCLDSFAPRFFLFLSAGLYFTYFSQLYCESKHGGHGALLVPSVLILLALSGGPTSLPWSLVFIKIFIGVIYLAGGMSKIVCSVVFRMHWGGATMQAYLFDATWSRPHPSAFIRWMIEALISNAWAMSFAALAGLIFEFGFIFLIIFGGPATHVLAALVAIGFHIGVDVLMGLDFLSFWCPVFWVFLPDLLELITPGSQPVQNTGMLVEGFRDEAWRVTFSACYVGLQLIVALRFMDMRDGQECLPFTCCPMFGLPRNLFLDGIKAGVSTEFSLRQSGYLDFAYNFFPWHTNSAMTQDDLSIMPGRVMLWIRTKRVPEILGRFLDPKFIGEDLLISANFKVPKELEAKLRELVTHLDTQREEDWMDPEKVRKAIDLSRECRALFDSSECLTRSSSHSILVREGLTGA